MINRLRPKLARVPGATLFLQAAQDVQIGGRAGQRAIPVHAAGRQPEGPARLGAAWWSRSCERSRNFGT